MMRMRTLGGTAVLIAALAAPVAAQVGKNIDNLVDPSRATKDQLAALPGMTPELADAIIAARPLKDMTAVNAILEPRLSAEQRTALYRRMWMPLNLNTATKEEILLIPGVGQRMLHEFEEYRPYAALAQFHREIDKYVDDAELARLEQYVFVPIDLNTASDADIMTIPGMGPRMLHEFKEYRPYRNIEQFRREIGKYVDEKEVARFERYVTIK